MRNAEISKILYEIGAFLEMQNIPFKPRAYEKVAEVMEELEEEAGDIYQRGGLTALGKIPGVGVSIAEKIEELLKTGRLKYYEDLKKKTPVDLSGLASVPGLGPKNIKKLYEKLGIKNLSDLEKAARAGKIGKIEGFGAKTEENILAGIEFLKTSGSRFVLGFLKSRVRELEARLKKLKEVERVNVAGSIRRSKETIGDVDILVTSQKPALVMDFFVSQPGISRVVAHGDTKSSVRLENGLEMDLRVVPEESYGAALLYFTGSKDHNVALREIAIKKGCKLNEYGLFKKEKNRDVAVAGKTEKEVYEKLGLSYIEPEMRENLGEVEAAAKGNLPDIIKYGSLKGDLQTQSDWTDGANSIYDMALKAESTGLQYMAVTDHTKRLAMANGLDEKRIVKQWAEIDKVNTKLRAKNSKLKVLKGTECDILKDGTLDLPDKILSKLDVVGVSVHSYFNLDEKTQTNRVLRALSNHNVDILFHPTGRIINKRGAINLNMDEVIKAAKKLGKILEVDAFPDRSDLKDEYIKKCVQVGVKMAIDSDAHSIQHFEYLEYGISQARRGWAEKKDIINAWPLEKMLGFIKH